jgi:hypothetical protein
LSVLIAEVAEPAVELTRALRMVRDEEAQPNGPDGVLYMGDDLASSRQRVLSNVSRLQVCDA